MGTPVTNRREKLLAKLWSKTVMIDGPLDTPCRIWTGQDSGKGRGGNYGRLTVDGGTMATNIVSFVIENGPIPPKKQIDHRCNNRRCWTPDHLQMVTHLKNQRLRAKRAKMVCEPLKEVV
jgi:hypothetical protein